MLFLCCLVAFLVQQSSFRGREFVAINTVIVLYVAAFVLFLFLMVPLFGLRPVIVVFLVHTQYFWTSKTSC